MKLKNIIILAGGKNTRFNEMSIFPKVLLPTLNYPSILYYNCELFKDYNIYLVMNSRYELMTRQYIEKNNLNINLVISHNHNGSSNTIKDIMSQIPNKEVLFVWSDLILDNNGLQSIINGVEKSIKNNIIFTYDGQYRFLASDDKIIHLINNHNKKINGNVPGIYYCEDLSKTMIYGQINFPNDFDFIEVLKYYQQDDYVTCKYDGDILEFRDLNTYINYYKSESLNTKTRFFNKMIVEDDKLTKLCINPSYYKLINREIDWYNKCKDNDYKNIPIIYNTNKDKHMIIMEYLRGYENIYNFIKSCDDLEFDKFIDTYLKAVEDLHKLDIKPVNKDIAYKDFKIEFYDKVIKRCDNISGILYDYNKDELKNILNKAFDKILKLCGDYNIYCFTHGDLNGSNVMYNKVTNDIKFIDPRGYFGDTQLIGPALYDYAKILYCFSGYDDFNNGRFKFTSKWYDEPKPLRKYEFKDNNVLYYIIVGIIWVALAEYISQDVMKANIAYRHGLKILNEYL